MPGWEGWTVRAHRRADGAVGSVTITAPAGTEVDPSRLARLPWQAALAVEVGPTPLVDLFAMELPARRTGDNAAAFDAALAALYRAALTHGLEPSAAIRERTGASARTVTRWLGNLRRHGLLASYEQERAEHGWPQRATGPDPRRVAADFRGVRDDPHRDQPVRHALAQRWGKTPATVDRWVRQARASGHLTDDDKIKPGRPRKEKGNNR